jgi:pyruvate kinase
VALDAAHPRAERRCGIPSAVRCGLLPVVAAVTYTTAGYTSLRAARERPVAPILSSAPIQEWRVA